MVQLCEDVGVHILNGAAGEVPAPFTSGTPNKGWAAVDYMLSPDPSLPVTYDRVALRYSSDHSILLVRIPGLGF